MKTQISTAEETVGLMLAKGFTEKEVATIYTKAFERWDDKPMIYTKKPAAVT